MVLLDLDFEAREIWEAGRDNIAPLLASLKRTDPILSLGNVCFFAFQGVFAAAAAIFSAESQSASRPDAIHHPLENLIFRSRY